MKDVIFLTDRELHVSLLRLEYAANSFLHYREHITPGYTRFKQHKNLTPCNLVVVESVGPNNLSSTSLLFILFKGNFKTQNNLNHNRSIALELNQCRCHYGSESKMQVSVKSLW